MATESSLLDIKNVIKDQNFGVLATYGREYPYTSIVGFLQENDLKTIVFATPKGTTKYINLLKNPKVSILITTSANRGSDFSEAAAVTALGEAKELSPDKSFEYKERYLFKFPVLKDFINDERTAIIAIKVEKYVLVTRFQDVKEVFPDDK